MILQLSQVGGSVWHSVLPCGGSQLDVSSMTHRVATPLHHTQNSGHRRGLPNWSLAWLPPQLAIALLILGLVLTATVVPGVFIADDNNYLVTVLALREGRVTVAATDGLTASRELLFFDPVPSSRRVESTPVASTAPPLYAFLALPFSVMGWRGLVALNTIAYLCTIALVFWYARQYASEQSIAWLAAGAFAFGGYAIEYAQGLWPHALSVALCTGGIAAAGRTFHRDCIPAAVLAGGLLGLAAGVRYQNAVVLAAVAGGICFWAIGRWRALAAFLLGSAVPLLTSSFVNHVRLDSWNPISKGGRYLAVPVLQEPGASLLAPLTMLWARVVDFSVRPQLTGPGFAGWLLYDPQTGAHLIWGIALKKALLQSAPWAILALVLFVLVWVPSFRVPNARRRQLQLFALVTFAILGAFSLSGVGRNDGLSFNQRYLFEILPLAAIGLAWAVDGLVLPVRALLAGAGVGATLVLVILLGTPAMRGPDVQLWVVRQLLLLKVPLFLAAAVAAVWMLALFKPKTGVRPVLAAALGSCLGWGLTLHGFDDLHWSRLLRRLNAERTAALDPVLVDRSALVAYWGNRDAAVPLLFDRDLMILDARPDEGKDAPLLIHELLNQGRRVFLVEDGFPPHVLSRIVATLHTTKVIHSSLTLLELHPRLNVAPPNLPGS